MNRQSHRQGAALLLVLMTVGGLTCPCRGILATLEAHSATCEDCTSSCCDCCHKKAPEPKPLKAPSSCCCLSGCCAVYLMPTQDNVLHEFQETSIVCFPPTLLHTNTNPLEPALTGWFPETTRVISLGTRLPGLVTLLI